VFDTSLLPISFFDAMTRQLFKNAKTLKDICNLLNQGKTLELKETKISSRYANVSSSHKEGRCDHKFKRSSDGYKKDDFCNNPVKDGTKCTTHSSSKGKKEQKTPSPDYVMERGIIISKANGSLLSNDDKIKLLSEGFRVLCCAISTKEKKACGSAVGIDGKDELLCPVHYRAKHSEKKEKEKETKKEKEKEKEKEDTDDEASASDSDSDDEDVNKAITLSREALQKIASISKSPKKPSPNK
jgi:hypothetical protein